MGLYLLGFGLFASACRYHSCRQCIDPWIWGLHLYMLCSVLWSIEPLESAERVFALWGGLCLIQYFVWRVSTAQMLRHMFFACWLINLSCLVGVVIMPDQVFHTDGPWAGTLRGVFFHKNALGYFCLFSLLISVDAWRRQTLSRLWSWSNLLMSGGLLLACQSMTSLLVAVLSVVVYRLAWSMVISAKTRMLVMCLALIVGLGLLALLHLGGGQWLVELLGRDVTLSNRVPIWQILSDYLAERPWLGFGYQAFWDQESYRVDYFSYLLGFAPHYSHSGYLELKLDGGNVALLLFGICFVRWWVALLSERAAHLPETPLFIAYLFAFAVVNTVEVKLMQKNEFTWLFLVYIAACLHRTPKEGRRVNAHES